MLYRTATQHRGYSCKPPRHLETSRLGRTPFCHSGEVEEPRKKATSSEGRICMPLEVR
jgi:hypothetical protein